MTVKKWNFIALGVRIISVGDIALSRAGSWRCMPVAMCCMACGRAIFVAWR